jgi:hypothetical protein
VLLLIITTLPYGGPCQKYREYRAYTLYGPCENRMESIRITANKMESIRIAGRNMDFFNNITEVGRMLIYGFTIAFTG